MGEAPRAERHSDVRVRAPVARVVRLSITPIKGTALRHPDAIDVLKTGAAGDRSFFLVGADGKVLSIDRTGAFARVSAEVGEDLALFEEGALVCRGPVEAGEHVVAPAFGDHVISGHVVPGPWTEHLSELVGRPVRLVKADAPSGAIDVAPVTLLGTASVARLAEHIGEPVDPRRFRMLIDLETDEPHVEDDWNGARLAGDEIELRVGDPVPRCAAITRHPDRGDRDRQLVRAIKDYRGLRDLLGGPGVPFGMYASVLREGRLRVGEQLRLVPDPVEP